MSAPQPNPLAIQTRIQNVLQSYLQGLGLVYTDGNDSQPTQLPAEQVYSKKIFTDRGILLPCLELFHGNLIEDLDDADQDFENTTLIFGFGLAYVFASDQDFEVNNDLLYWRQLLIDAFLDFPDALRTALEEAIPTTVACEWDCRLELRQPVDPDFCHDKNLDVGGMIVKIKTTYSRNRS